MSLRVPSREGSFRSPRPERSLKEHQRDLQRLLLITHALDKLIKSLRWHSPAAPEFDGLELAVHHVRVGMGPPYSQTSCCFIDCQKKSVIELLTQAAYLHDKLL